MSAAQEGIAFDLENAMAKLDEAEKRYEIANRKSFEASNASMKAFEDRNRIVDEINHLHAAGRALGMKMPDDVTGKRPR